MAGALTHPLGNSWWLLSQIWLMTYHDISWHEWHIMTSSHFPPWLSKLTKNTVLWIFSQFFLANLHNYQPWSSTMLHPPHQQNIPRGPRDQIQSQTSTPSKLQKSPSRVTFFGMFFLITNPHWFDDRRFGMVANTLLSCCSHQKTNNWLRSKACSSPIFVRNWWIKIHPPWWIGRLASPKIGRSKQSISLAGLMWGIPILGGYPKFS